MVRYMTEPTATTASDDPHAVPAGTAPGPEDAAAAVAPGLAGRPTAATPPVTVTADPRRWWTLGVLCLSVVLIAVDTTILNVALPTLGRTIATSTGQLQWIVDAYTVVFAGLLLTCGSIGDRSGRRRALAAGLVVFALGCLASALVDTAGQLIAMRALTGVGAALIFPATLSIITNVFRDPTERQRAIAVWASTAGIGIALGPLTGGLLLEHFYWGSIFLVNVPVVAIALVGVWLAVPESRDPVRRRLDPLGAGLSILGLGTLVYGVIRGGSDGWIDGVTLGALAAGVVLIALFVVHEIRSPAPMLDVRVFRNPRFTGASVAVSAVYFCLFGTIFLVTQHMQVLLGYGTLAAGIRTLPVAVVLMIVANLTPRIVARMGPKVPIVGGLLVVAVSQLARIASTPDTGYPLIFIGQVIFAAGMGLLVAPATASIMGSLPPERAGVGSAMNDTTRQVGGALGVAVMGSVAAATYRNALDDRLAPVGLPARALATARESLGSALHVASGSGGGRTSQLVSDAGRASFITGLRWASLVAIVVALVGAATAWRLLPSGRGIAADEGPGVDARDPAHQAAA
jgi:EmrB/QacA subfamily drug resistance transporter